MLEKVFNASSVAVVGASKDETKRGYQTIRTLLDEKYEWKGILKGSDFLYVIYPFSEGYRVVCVNGRSFILMF